MRMARQKTGRRAPLGHFMEAPRREWLGEALVTLALIFGALSLITALIAWPGSANASEPPKTRAGVFLLMLEEDGCPWCERWDEEIGAAYARTPEGQCAPLRRVDIHDRLPSDLKWLTTGNYTPTFVLIEDGRELGRIRGYPGEEFFYPLLNQLLARLTEPCVTKPNTN